MIRRILLTVASTLVLIGLLGLSTDHSRSTRLRSARVTIDPAPTRDPLNELREALEELDRAESPGDYPSWVEFPIHPVTGRVMDPLFDCPGMLGPPPTEWDYD